MNGLNKVTLIGHLGKDPERLPLEAGNVVGKFTLATTEGYTDAAGQRQSTTEWHQIVVWNKLADMAHNYLHKGSHIYLEGKIKTRTYDTKEGEKRYVTEIIADHILMLDKAGTAAKKG